MPSFEPGRTLSGLVSGDAATTEAAYGVLQGLADRNVPQRIRQRDHTVWRAEPREISDRLAWLDAGDFLREHLDDLAEFVGQVCSEGYRDVVLLGMGGSCLGPEVLRQAYGQADGFPRLTLLDSTVPAQIGAVASSIDPAATLFIVSSKSGGTTRPCPSIVTSAASSSSVASRRERAGTSLPSPIVGHLWKGWPTTRDSDGFS